jgi:beta-N-acetylhexosaminidase
MLAIAEVGRHLVAGFDGTDWNDHLEALLADLGVGGIILFTRNFESPEQLQDLILRIRDRSKERIFIGVDQEGGRVARFKAPFTDWPTMRALANTNDPELATRFGKALGTELASVGIEWVFAPVMDVDSNPDNPVIGDRAFGADPALVAQMGVAVIGGIQSAGVMACAKHFPGHGDTSEDSHETLPMVVANEEILFRRECAPFVAAIDANVASIMPAHVIYPAFDMAHPASVSRTVISGTLRQALGFNRLVITDDLEMKAVVGRYEPSDLFMMAFYAGNDFLLACHTFEMQEQIVRTLYDARTAGVLAVEMYTQSQKRIVEATKRYAVPAKGELSVIGCGEHLEMARTIIEKSAQAE